MASATRTVLFTDLANYTAEVSRTDREGLRRILADHERAVRPIVDRHGGRIVKNIGDSFLCLFDAATDAVRAALEIQSAARSQEAVGIRIALNTGDVEEIDGDAFGETVNVAARVLARTPEGETWFGPGTRACMNEAEIAWDSVGMLSLKGIAGDRECYRAVPLDRTWLPASVAEAACNGKLVRIRPDEEVPNLPTDPLVLFQDFEAGSDALEEAVGRLPVLDPASLFLVAYQIPAADRHDWTRAGRGLIVGSSEAVDAAIRGVVDESRTGAGRSLDDSATMFLDMRTELELVVCGLALPAVPLSHVVASYTYDLRPDAQWVPVSEEAVIRVEVLPDKVLLHALVQGVRAGGQMLSAGDAFTLSETTTVVTSAGEFEYRPANSGYAGVMLAETPLRLGVARGQSVEMGRRPNPPGLPFPAREGGENIRWCSGNRAARARSNHFTLDRVLTGRRQAAIRASGNNIHLVPLHEECPTFVLRGARMQRATRPVYVHAGDMIVAGTTVVCVRATD